jgi:hypothetical protein
MKSKVWIIPSLVVPLIFSSVGLFLYGSESPLPPTERSKEIVIKRKPSGEVTFEDGEGRHLPGRAFNLDNPLEASIKRLQEGIEKELTGLGLPPIILMACDGPNCSCCCCSDGSMVHCNPPGCR